MRIHWMIWGGLAVSGALLALPTAAPAASADASLARRDRAKVELGRRLFFDPAVSREGRVACAACHDPDHGFSDKRVQSVDENGKLPRHSQTVLDLSGEGFHWDGEFPTPRELILHRLAEPETVAALALERMTGRVETSLERGDTFDREEFRRRLPQTLANPTGYNGRATTPSTAALTAAVAGIPALTTVQTLPRRLREDRLYVPGFQRAFGTKDITTDHIADALVAYLGTLRSTESPFDRYMAGVPNAMTAAAERGFELFAGKAGCATCHTIGGKGANRALSDGRFHNTGVAFRGFDLNHTLGADKGYGGHTFQTPEAGTFKTANLRDVALRAPYMHDGSFKTLEEVVRYYDEGGTPNTHLDPAIRELGLSDREVSDVVAFLEALSGDERPGLGPLPDHRPDRARIKIVDMHNKAMRGVKVTVRPFGDRLRGTRHMPEPFERTTDKAGYLYFAYPASTHVVLEMDDHEVGNSRPVPDWVASKTLTAVPRDVVAVRVRRDRKTKRLPSEISVSPVGSHGQAIGGSGGALRRVRTIDRASALYSMPAPGSGLRRTHRLSSPQHPFLGIFRLDMVGGMADTIDLRRRSPDETMVRRQTAAAQKLFSLVPGITPRRPPPKRR